MENKYFEKFFKLNVTINPSHMEILNEEGIESIAGIIIIFYYISIHLKLKDEEKEEIINNLKNISKDLQKKNIDWIKEGNINRAKILAKLYSKTLEVLKGEERPTLIIEKEKENLRKIKRKEFKVKKKRFKPIYIFLPFTILMLIFSFILINPHEKKKEILKINIKEIEINFPFPTIKVMEMENVLYVIIPEKEKDNIAINKELFWEFKKENLKEVVIQTENGDIVKSLNL